MNQIIREIDEQYTLHSNIPDFKSGDTVAVDYKIIEGEKERIQRYQGVVISMRGSDAGKTFIVRKISHGIGVERIFPFYSPNIVKITRIRAGRVRRAKLYYLRSLRGKAAKIRESR
ncbi:MAG: 50S ribosomal protein L19 [Candidatus Marinimicrobia bacterium]|nr:50S ribosomal protein L19 [Candidatus Neomarinimicrobiota bacterium]